VGLCALKGGSLAVQGTQGVGRSLPQHQALQVVCCPGVAQPRLNLVLSLVRQVGLEEDEAAAQREQGHVARHGAFVTGGRRQQGRRLLLQVPQNISGCVQGLVGLRFIVRDGLQTLHFIQRSCLLRLPGGDAAGNAGVCGVTHHCTAQGGTCCRM
jgi:hypothetical protein